MSAASLLNTKPKQRSCFAHCQRLKGLRSSQSTAKSTCHSPTLTPHTKPPGAPAFASSKASLVPRAAAPHAHGLPHPTSSAPQRPLESTAATKLTAKSSSGSHPKPAQAQPAKESKVQAGASSPSAFPADSPTDPTPTHPPAPAPAAAQSASARPPTSAPTPTVTHAAHAQSPSSWPEPKCYAQYSCPNP